jgi:hypothetical protein
VARASTRQLNALGVASRSSVRGRRTNLIAISAPPGAGALVGIGILGRAATHAYRFGDMADDEAADFVIDVGGQLLIELGFNAPR